MMRNEESNESKEIIQKIPVYAIYELVDLVDDASRLHFRDDNVFLDKVAAIIYAAYPDLTGTIARKLREALPLMLEKIRASIYRNKSVLLSHACEAAVSVCFFEIHQSKKDADVRLFFESGLIVIQYVAALVGQLKHFKLYNNIEEVISLYNQVEQRYDETLAYDKERFPDKGLDSMEKEKLLHYANCIKICLPLINNPHGKRTRVIRLVTALVEGPDIKYISGSGMTPQTRRRITIFEQESGVFPKPPTLTKIGKIYSKIKTKKRRNLNVADDEYDNFDDILGSYSMGNRSSYIVSNNKLKIDSQEVVNNKKSKAARINRVHIDNTNVYTSYVQTTTKRKIDNKGNKGNNNNKANKKAKKNEPVHEIDKNVTIPKFNNIPNIVKDVENNNNNDDDVDDNNDFDLSVFDNIGFDNLVCRRGSGMPNGSPQVRAMQHGYSNVINNRIIVTNNIYPTNESVNDDNKIGFDDNKIGFDDNKIGFDNNNLCTTDETDDTDDEDLDAILNDDDFECLLSDPKSYADKYPDMTITTNTSEVNGKIIQNVVFSTRNDCESNSTDDEQQQQMDLNEICQFANDSVQQEFFDDMACTLNGGITQDDSGACAFSLCRISTLDRAFSANMRSMSQSNECELQTVSESTFELLPPSQQQLLPLSYPMPSMSRQVSHAFLDHSKFLFRGISLSENDMKRSASFESATTLILDEQYQHQSQSPSLDYDQLLSTT